MPYVFVGLPLPGAVGSPILDQVAGERSIPLPSCEYYPYLYSLHPHLHQRTHLCEATRSQHYTKTSRNPPLSWYCFCVDYSRHSLILCRFAAPPQVASRHSLYYLRSISVSKNQRRISFLSMGGLISKLRRTVAPGFPILWSRKVGCRIRELSLSSMKHNCRIKTSTFGPYSSRTCRVPMIDSPSPLRAMVVRPRWNSKKLHHSLSATRKESRYALLTMVMAPALLDFFSTKRSSRTSLLNDSPNPTITSICHSLVTSLISLVDMWEQSTT